MQGNLVALLAVLPLVCPAAAFAHDTWLLPESAAVAVGSEVGFDLTSGMAFPSLDHAITPDRVEFADCRLAGLEVPLSSSVGEKSLRLSARFAVPGVAVCRVDLRPRELELQLEQVAHYLDEIGAPATVRQAWAAMKPQRWRERYSKHAKTFVAVGVVGGDQSWAQPVGSPFEFVPESDPSAVRAGSDLVVRFVKGTAAMVDFAVSLLREGEQKASSLRTDASGRVTIHVTETGRYLLRATEIRPPATSGAPWESDFTTLTFSVR